jgi:hypothetical protein
LAALASTLTRTSKRDLSNDGHHVPDRAGSIEHHDGDLDHRVSLPAAARHVEGVWQSGAVPVRSDLEAMLQIIGLFAIAVGVALLANVRCTPTSLATKQPTWRLVYGWPIWVYRAIGAFIVANGLIMLLS